MCDGSYAWYERSGCSESCVCGVCDMCCVWSDCDGSFDVCDWYACSESFESSDSDVCYVCYDSYVCVMKVLKRVLALCARFKCVDCSLCDVQV